MEGFRFYLEYPDGKSKRAATRKDISNHTGNCVALWEGKEHIWTTSSGDIQQEAFVAVHETPDSPCCFGAVSWGYLREKCKRISEIQARAIHPNLFYRLES